MNVVIFRNGSHGPRQFSLTSPGFITAAVAVIAAVTALVFGAGYTLALQKNDVADTNEMRAMAEDLEVQRAALEAAKRRAQDTLDALAIRIGRMNAHIVRLDALGQRLTEMADLEDGEFDFQSQPPIGGPEETEIFLDMDEEGLRTQLDSLDLQIEDRARQLGVLESVMLSRNLGEQTRPRGRPVDGGWISSYFGMRTDPFTGKKARHKGIDFAGKAGANIHAVGSGVVTYSGSRYGYGLMVEIDHGDGFVTRYAHNAENTVVVGQEVQKGQLIGYMGSTGRATGPNMHFEVLKDGAPQNPVNYIRDAIGN
ncbi:MAG: M23 family metallopeptidase [Pseudomonadota bacterium]